MQRPQRSTAPVTLEQIQNPLDPQQREVRPFGPPLGADPSEAAPRRAQVIQHPLTSRPQRSDQPVTPDMVQAGSPISAPDIRRQLGQMTNIAQAVELSENPDEELAMILSAEYLSHKLGVPTEDVLRDFDHHSQRYYGLNITPQTAFQATRNAVARGQAAYDMSRGMAGISDEQATWHGDGTLTPDQEARFQELKAQGDKIPPPDETNRGFLGRQWVLMLEATFEQVPRMLGSMSRAVPAALQDASAAALAAAVGGLPMQAVPGIGQVAHKASVAGVFGWVFSGSMKVRSTAELARAYRGMTFMEIMDRVDENGRRPDARAAAAAATAAGVLAGASEFMALSMIPGASRVYQTAFNQALTRTLSRNLISNRVVNALVRHGVSVGFGVLNEIYQETMQILGTELGLVLDEGVNGGRWDRPTAEDIKERLLQIGAMAARSYFLMGVPGTAVAMKFPSAEVQSIKQGDKSIAGMERLRARVLEGVEAASPEVKALTAQYDKILADMLIDPSRQNVSEAISLAAQLDRMNPDESTRIIQEAAGMSPESMARNLWQLTREDMTKMEQVTAQNLSQNLLDIIPKIGEDGAQYVTSVMGALARAAGMDLNSYLESRIQGFQKVDPVPGIRGAVQIFQGIANEYRGVVQLSENADFSTVLHEVFHVEERRAAAGQVSIFSQEDYGILKAWAQGLMDTDADSALVSSGEWTQDQFIAEKVTQGFERYLADGIAPTSEMQTLFAKVAEFLRKIYDSIFSKLPELSPQARAVFDRVFSSEARAARDVYLHATPEGRAELASLRSSQDMDVAEQTLFQRTQDLTPPPMNAAASVIGTPQVKSWIQAVNNAELLLSGKNKKAKKIPPLTRAYVALAEANERVQLTGDNAKQVEAHVATAITDILTEVFDTNDQQVLEAMTWYDKDIGYMRDTLTRQIPELASDDYWYAFLAVSGVTSMQKKPVQNLWAAMSVMKFWMRTGEMPVFQFDSAYNKLYDTIRSQTEEVQTKTGKTKNRRLYTDAQARQMAEQQTLAEGIKSNWNYRVFGLTSSGTVGAVQAARPVMGQKLLELQTAFRSFDGDVAKLREFLVAEHSGRDINAVTGASNLALTLPFNGMEFIGPKVGQFALALGGNQSYVVKDLWFSRFWNRTLGTPWQSYEMTTEKARLSSRAAEELAAETPRGKGERRAMENAVRDAKAQMALKGYTLTESQIQAMLWNYEKRIYRDLDLMSGEEESYRNGADHIQMFSDKLTPTDGSGFVQGDPQQVLDQIIQARRDAGVDPLATTDGVDHIFSGDDRFIQSEPPFLRSLDMFFQGVATDTPQFKSWFGDSRVVDESGQPKVVYHATGVTAPFAAFDTSLSDGGAHFGAIEHAEAVTGGNLYPWRNLPESHMRMYPVYLNLQNPVVLTDLGNFNAQNVFLDLTKRGILTESEATQMANRIFNLPYEPGNESMFTNFEELSKARTKLQQTILKDMGYDGVEYYNRREGITDAMWEDLEEIASLRTSAKIPVSGGGNWNSYQVIDTFTDEQFVRFMDEHGITAKLSYIAFDPSQVKSIYNRGEWDPMAPEMYGQRAAISVEARPGLTTGDRWAWMQNLSYQQQQELLADVFGALRDADGLNGVAKLYGIPEVGVVETPGSWEGQTNPSYQLQLEYDGINAESIDQIESYASALGLLFRQDGVGWNAINPLAQNPTGVLVRVGRVINPQEMAALDTFLGTLGGLVPVGTGDGVHILNFSGIPGSQAAHAVESFLNESGVIDSDYDIGPAQFDGGLVENNWQEQPNGEGYLLRNMASGSSSIIERARSLYGPEVDRAYQAFEQRVRPPGPRQYFQGSADRRSSPLYSSLELAAVDMKEGHGTGEKMLDLLRNTPGVTLEEIYWSGVEEFLEGRENVTEEEIQNHITNNRIRMEEKILLDFEGMSDHDRKVMIADRASTLRYEYTQKVADLVAAKDYDKLKRVIPLRTSRLTFEATALTPEQVIQYATLEIDSDVWESIAEEDIRSQTVLYPEHTLFEEQGYNLIPFDDVDIKDQPGSYREMVFYVEKEGLEFEGGPHWGGDQNEVGHMRSAVYRTLGDMHQVFYVEEVQSDVHQKYRAKIKKFRELEAKRQEHIASGLVLPPAFFDSSVKGDSAALLAMSPADFLYAVLGQRNMYNIFRFDDRVSNLIKKRNGRQTDGPRWTSEGPWVPGSIGEVTPAVHEMAHTLFFSSPEFWGGRAGTENALRNIAYGFDSIREGLSQGSQPLSQWANAYQDALGRISSQLLSARTARSVFTTDAEGWQSYKERASYINEEVAQEIHGLVRKLNPFGSDFSEANLTLENVQKLGAHIDSLMEKVMSSVDGENNQNRATMVFALAAASAVNQAVELKLTAEAGLAMPAWVDAFGADLQQLMDRRIQDEIQSLKEESQELLENQPPMKNWHEMVFRRGVLEAIHNDLQWFGWSGGEIQSVRWQDAKLPTAIYDEFWVNQAKKLAKKYGVEVKEVTIGTLSNKPGSALHASDVDATTREAKVWAFELTDQMKEDLEKTGMKLFQREDAWWANRHGDLVNAEATHIRNVLDNPSEYGFTHEELVAVYKKHGEKIGQEGNAREEIIRELNARNWMRIRHYRYPLDYWSLTIGSLKEQRHQVEEFIFRAMEELDMKPQDQLQVVSTSDNQIQAWTFQQGGVKAALEEISMLAQRDPRYEAVTEAVLSGDWVEESVLGEFAGSPVIDAELTIRADLMSEAALFDSFEDFLDYVAETDPDPSSTYYYQEIWNAGQELPKGAREVANSQWVESLGVEKTVSIVGAVGLLGRSSELGDKSVVALAEWVRTHKRKPPPREMIEAAQLEMSLDPGRYRQIIADITVDDAEVAALLNEERTDRVKVDLELAIREARDARIKEADAKARAEQAEESGKEQTAELRKLRARKSAREAMRDMRKRQDERGYRKKLIRNIMTIPSVAIDYPQATQIRALQDQYFVNRSRRIEQLQEVMQGYTHGEVDGTVLASVLSQQNLKDLTVEQLEALYEQVSQLKEQGRLNRWMRLLEERAEIAEAVEGITGEVLQGHTLEDDDFRGSVKSKAQMKLGVLGMIKKMALRPSRVARWLTGGERGILHDWLVRRVNRAEDAAITMTHQRLNEGTAKMVELGVTPKTLSEKIATHQGIEFRVDDVLTMYIGLQNEQSAHHLVYGNKIPLDMQQAMIKQLTPQHIEWADWMIESFGTENYNRLMEVLVQDENRTAPRVDRYFPIKVDGQNFQFANQEAASDIMSRSPYSRQYAKKGMTKGRVNRSAQPIRLGATKVWATAVADQENYINKGLMVKKLQRIVNDPQLQSALRQEFGQPMNEWMQKFVNDWANPDIYRAHNAAEKGSRLLRNNAYLSYLGFNVVTMAKQVPSVAFYLPRAGAVHMMSSVAQFSANPSKVIEFVRANDPQVMDRAINRFQQELDLLEGGSYAMLSKKIGKVSMKGIQMMDTMAVTIGWKAVYDRVIQENRDNPMAHEMAVEEAQLATLETQPQARAKDLAELYRSGESMNWFLMFSNQLNQVFNTILQDIPDDIRHHQYGRALATMMGLGISASVIGWMNHRDLPEDADEVPEILGKYMLDQVISSIPIVGGSVKAGMEGWFGTGIDPLPIASQLGRTARTLRDADADGGKKFDAMMKLMIEAMVLTGFPTVQTRRIHDTFFADRWFEDPQFDPWELIGGLD